MGYHIDIMCTTAVTERSCHNPTMLITTRSILKRMKSLHILPRRNMSIINQQLNSNEFVDVCWWIRRASIQLTLCMHTKPVWLAFDTIVKIRLSRRRFHRNSLVSIRRGNDSIMLSKPKSSHHSHSWRPKLASKICLTFWHWWTCRFDTRLAAATSSCCCGSALSFFTTTFFLRQTESWRGEIMYATFCYITLWIPLL